MSFFFEGSGTPNPTHRSKSARVLTEGRLGARPSPTLVEHVNKLELDDELVGVEQYVLMDLAHALMLTQQGIFSSDQGRSILGALLSLLEAGPSNVLDADPEVGTLGLQIERYLETECGPTGRDIQRARSRIDQKATGWRMTNRWHLLAVMDASVELGATLLGAARKFEGTLSPGYTHLQHSQPTTLDHYFNAHYWAVSRNLDRALEAYSRLNVSPLGGAAYSGTSWPIDRNRTAAYLGFSRPIANARDAGFAGLDMGAELAGVLALILSGISRVAGDLNYWASSEVGLVRIAANLCGTSSMMPQKRNPISLERIRGLAGTAVGWAAGQLGVMHTATSTDVDQAYVHNMIPTYCQETAGAIALMTEAIATVEVDVPTMRRSAGRKWATASALADDLVRNHELSFRAAHGVVAQFVTAHEREGIPAGDVRPELGLDPLSLYTPERLRKILDPESFVQSRTSAGGTSPQSRAELASSAQADLDRLHSAVAELEGELVQSRDRLLLDANALVSQEHEPHR